jgi:hypothetical protein
MEDRASEIGKALKILANRLRAANCKNYGCGFNKNGECTSDTILSGSTVCYDCIYIMEDNLE